MTILRLDALLRTLPRPATPKWPDGVRDVHALELHGANVAVFAPRGVDRQTPHGRDELYFVVSGEATFEGQGEDDARVSVGDVVLVEAGRAHRFKEIAEDFATWVVFLGPSTTGRG